MTRTLISKSCLDQLSETKLASTRQRFHRVPVASTSMTSDDDVKKYLFLEGKDPSGFQNPIGSYVNKNSVREPDILRRLKEVHYLLIIYDLYT